MSFAPAAAKKASKNFARTAKTSGIQPVPTSPPTLAKSSSPRASRAKKSTPVARTSGSANGSLITEPGRRLATALAAATIVAVAPTLVAKSQVSSSLRFIATLVSHLVGHATQYYENPFPTVNLVPASCEGTYGQEAFAGLGHVSGLHHPAQRGWPRP